MSRTWWLTTNTDLSLAAVAEWLTGSKCWTCGDIDSDHQRLVSHSLDKTITLVCSDRRVRHKGTASFAGSKIGTPSTLTFTLELSRAVNHCGRLDEIYAFAFEFSQFDSECNLYFELEDRGIFKRLDNQYVVNPDQFFAKSLAGFLTFPYRLADGNRNELEVLENKL